jgi:hypothetical protein
MLHQMAISLRFIAAGSEFGRYSLSIRNTQWYLELNCADTLSTFVPTSNGAVASPSQ